MEITKTDLKKILQYLGDSAKLHDAQPDTRNRNRARLIRLLISKLKIKDYDNRQTQHITDHRSS